MSILIVGLLIFLITLHFKPKPVEVRMWMLEDKCRVHVRLKPEPEKGELIVSFVYPDACVVSSLCINLPPEKPYLWEVEKPPEGKRLIVLVTLSNGRSHTASLEKVS